MVEVTNRVIKARQLTQSDSRVAVDIIVPFYGQYERLCRLVESVNRVVRIPHQTHLVDDCSPNQHFTAVARASKLTVTRNEKHVGFGASLEVGFLATKSPFVAFVHSDTELMTGCLDRMIESLLALREKKVGMIAARTDQPGPGMDTRLLAKRGDVRDDVILSEGFLPFYCVVAWRHMFQRTGFIRPYFPVGYEDEEFAYRMRGNGFKQAICGKAWVRHVEGSTIRALCAEKPQMVERIEQNRDFCLSDIRKLMVTA